MTPRHQWIKGFCPACGHEKLYRRQSDNKIVCSRYACPEPMAAHQILTDHETGHIVEFHREGGFSIWHPLRERIDRRILSCPLHAWLEHNRPDVADRPGQYRAVDHEDHWLFQALDVQDHDDVYPGS